MVKGRVLQRRIERLGIEMRRLRSHYRRGSMASSETEG
jgi:hypothetical protein